jgi:peptidoglycan/LPS O-acetylase OafA/YrhL
MNAAFFSPHPRSASPASKEATASKGQRARRIHRWVATIFTLTVAANFAAMPWGQPPAWITYAPLPPLLFLTITGLTMLVSSWIGQARAKRASRKGTVQ